MQYNKTYDIVVAGAGIAGLAAAYKAGKMGMKVLLVEHYAFPGGMATSAMVSPFMKSSAADQELVKGFYENLKNGMQELNAMIDNGFYAWAFRYQANKMLKEVNVDMAFQSDVVDVITSNNKVTGIKIVSCDGLREIIAKQFIDTTGDAQLVNLGNFAYEKGDVAEGNLQSQTLFFRMGGIDFESVINYCKKHPEDFFDWVDLKADLSKIIAIAGYRTLVNNAQKEKRIPDDVGYIFFASLPSTGEASFNTTNITQYDGSVSGDLTSAELDGNQQVMQIVDFIIADIPGFENAFLMETGTQVGVRETRRAIADYMVTGEDIIKGTKFTDAVARGSYGIDIHGQKKKDDRMDELEEGKWYSIPLRSLLVRDATNLLVAGRCIGATREGHSALRIMPTSSATGEAAGALAALAVKNNLNLREVNHEWLKAQISYNIG